MHGASAGEISSKRAAVVQFSVLEMGVSVAAGSMRADTAMTLRAPHVVVPTQQGVSDPPMNPTSTSISSFTVLAFWHDYDLQNSRIRRQHTGLHPCRETGKVGDRLAGAGLRRLGGKTYMR